MMYFGHLSIAGNERYRITLQNPVFVLQVLLPRTTRLIKFEITSLRFRVD